MKHEPILHRWVIEKSHMLAVPNSYMAASVDHLKQLVIATADSKTHRPIVGLLEFTHLVRNGKETMLVFFRDANNKKRRFMRLVRD